MSPPSPSSLFLLERLVHTYPADDDDTSDNIQGPGRVLSTGAKLAFGFRADRDADSVVQGLALEAKLAGAPDLSTLVLRGGGNRSTCVHTVDRNLVLIAARFTQVHHRGVLLVYDGVDKSLHMIPTWPQHACAPFLTYHVLVARRRDDDRSYALVRPGRELVSLSDDGVAQWRHALLLSPRSSASPWETTKAAKFPDHLISDFGFHAEEVFSSRGRGYYADLLRGAMYCDYDDVLSDDIDCVHFSSLDLPLGCPRYLGRRDDIPESIAFRAMGCVGDSIKFVTIDGYLERLELADFKVRVWRLTEDMGWALEHELKLGSLWEDQVEFKGNGVPVPVGMAPMYPLLTSEQEDHVIYFALGQYVQGVYNCFPNDPRCLVRVDMDSKTFSCTSLPPSVGCTIMGSLVALSGNANGNLLGLSG